MNRVLVVGSANADLVFRVPEFPKPGETISSTEFHTMPGGKGANQAVAAARFGAHVFFCGGLGKDNLGDYLWSEIEGNGVDLGFSMRKDIGTGTAAILVNDHGENQIVISAGANGMLSSDDVCQAIEGSQPDLILTQMETPESTLVACVQSGIRCIVNPAPFREIPLECLSDLFAISPNQSEASKLAGLEIEDIESGTIAARKLSDMGVRNVFLTLGAQGCLWFDGQEMTHVPAPSVVPVDTTGAGDTFNGALAAGLAAGRPTIEALRQAVYAASLSTLKVGAMTAPTFKEVIKLMV